MQNLCMLETNIIRGATQIDLKVLFSYTNIYAAVVTVAEAVSPYYVIHGSGQPSKVHSAILFISRSHRRRLSGMGKKSLLLFFNGLIYWVVS